MVTELGDDMVKPGPKPKENTLSVRVQFRISPETLAAYEGLAEVLEVPTHNLMRQALDESAGLMITMASAFRQMKGGDPMKGLQLYKQLLGSFGPQLEVQQSVSDEWIEQLTKTLAERASGDSELVKESGTD